MAKKPTKADLEREVQKLRSEVEGLKQALKIVTDFAELMRATPAPQPFLPIAPYMPPIYPGPIYTQPPAPITPLPIRIEPIFTLPLPVTCGSAGLEQLLGSVRVTAEN
jgi:hypothetical protein